MRKTLFALGATGILVVFPASLAGQRYDVKIVDRQNNETDYSYVVPSYSSLHSISNANCAVTSSNLDCNGSTTITGYSTPAHEVSFHVRGATFILLLSDGRAAVVNCESKFAERFAGRAGNHRDCRMPLVDNIQAEFKGDKAKLEWVISLDGKKMQSETYKALAVLDKPATNP